MKEKDNSLYVYAGHGECQSVYDFWEMTKSFEEVHMPTMLYACNSMYNNGCGNHEGFCGNYNLLLQRW